MPVAAGRRAHIIRPFATAAGSDRLAASHRQNAAGDAITGGLQNLKRPVNIVACRDIGVRDDHQLVRRRDEARHGLVFQDAARIDDDEIVVLAKTIEAGDEAVTLLRSQRTQVGQCDRQEREAGPAYRASLSGSGDPCYPG